MAGTRSSLEVWATVYFLGISPSRQEVDRTIEVEMRLRTDEVVQQETDGETVLLDLRSSTYFVVNGSGTCLLPLLLKGAERQDLLDALLDTFEIGPEQAEIDLDRFLQDLRRQDLVVE